MFQTSYGRKVNRRSGRGPINFLDEMNIKQSLVSCYTSSIFIVKRYTRCKHCIYLTNCATFSDDRSIIGALVPPKLTSLYCPINPSTLSFLCIALFVQYLFFFYNLCAKPNFIIRFKYRIINGEVFNFNLMFPSLVGS